jgi:hypothetical protein
MFWQPVRIALVAGVIAAGAAVSARADDCCAPVTCTRTSYRVECRQETYTAYRCECVPETRTRTCTVYKNVPEVKTVTRSYCVCVPVVEERTVMRAHVTCKPVTTTCRRCVDHGHYECREVPCHERHCKGLLTGLFHKHHGCCDDCCEPCPPPTKTVKVWVPCKVWEEVPVTRMERVCEYRPEVCKVTTYKREMRQENVQVTCMKCVPEQRTENYTVMVSKTVPYTATRTVRVCVPVTETVTCCASPCGESCGRHFRHRCCHRSHGCCD